MSNRQVRELPSELSEVARLLALGLDDRAMGRAVGASVRTVRRRVALLYSALGARTRFQAGYLWALRSSRQTETRDCRQERPRCR